MDNPDQNLIGASAVGVVAFDPESLRYTFSNPTYAEMTGFTREELAKLTLADLARPEDRHSLQMQIENLASGNGSSLRIEQFHARKDGKFFWADICCTSVMHAQQQRPELLCFVSNIDDRRHWEKTLQESEERWKLALEAAGDGVWDWDISQDTVIFSDRYKQMYGFSDDDIAAREEAWVKRIHPDDRARVDGDVHAYLEGRSPAYMNEHRIICKDGSIKWVLARGMIVSVDMAGRPIRMIGTHADISGRKHMEEELRAKEAYVSAILENEPECVKVIGADGRLLQMNQAGLDMLEIDSIDEGNQLGLMNFLGPEYRQDFAHLLAAVLQGQSERMEFEIIGKRGTHRWLDSHVAPLRDGSGNIIGLVGVTRDISDRKMTEQRLAHLAHHDALTGLPNRTLINDRLQQAVAKARRAQSHLALMFLDLDNFKPVNDNLGHDVGDELLKMVATRLLESVRASDTVARIGGDEFVVLLQEIEKHQDATVVAEKILAALRQSFEIAGNTIHISTSIGIASYPEHGGDEKLLLINADIAMYHAKKNGRNNFSFYVKGMQGEQ